MRALHVNKLFIYLLAFCVAFWGSCMVKPAVIVTDDDSGSKVEIKQGDELAVRLAAQLGTGYGWKVVSKSDVLALKGEPAQISNEDQKPGSSEFQTFIFKAKERGEAEIKFQYIEAWKKDARPLKEYTITVIIK
jgi:predicted secreted protein